MTHKLPALPYDYDALEPHIDTQTMRIHHSKHHQGYVDKLNAALEGHEDLLEKDVETLLREIDQVPQEIRQTVINSGGGHANHALYWTMLSPVESQPSNALADAINTTFRSFDNFKQQFTAKANSVFGSGWTWLVIDNGKLAIESTSNQDSPLSQGKTPILTLDLWEHSFYLLWQNRRTEYIETFWNIINWEEVGKRFDSASK